MNFVAKAGLTSSTALRGALSSGLIGLAAVACVASTAVAAELPTTFSQTIRDLDQDNLLDRAPGEAHAVRQELAAAEAGRASRRVPRLGFVQFTDTHIVDEESPLRVEYVDRNGPPLTSAYRPHEGVSPQVMDQMVRQVRSSVSPVTGRPPEMVMTTGDNSDNAQLNEVRDFIDILDGGVRVNPDSGLQGTCGTPDDGTLYDGVRGGGAYYEPDRSSPPGAGEDGDGYAPREAENKAEAGRSNRLRDFPGLYESMNKPFQTVGLGIPWYGIFGNHDGLIQGNQPRNEALERVAVGCLKVTDVSPGAEAEVVALAAGGITPEEGGQVFRIITDDMINTVNNPVLAERFARVVPRDPERLPLKKVEFIRQHFTTGGEPVGHGFTARNLESGQGSYSFVPKPDVRFVVLDSINEAGFSDGNIDDAQFRYIHRQLLAAEVRKQVVMLFAHHSLRTMNQPPASPFPRGDIGGNPSFRVHFGLGLNGSVAACALTDPAAEPTLDETLRCLFLRHPSVIAFVSGHEHINRVTPFPKDDANPRRGGFWEVTTASHIDWPQQSRLLDIVDNVDGTLSIFGTILDHASALRTSIVPNGDEISAVGVSQLATISREMSFNDPDADNGEDGHSDARGARLDRNVELVINDPYAAP